MNPKDPTGVPGEIEIELAGPGHMAQPAAAPADVPDLDLGPRKGPVSQSIPLASQRPGQLMAPPPSSRTAPAKPANSAFDDDADLMKPGGASFDLDFGAAGDMRQQGAEGAGGTEAPPNERSDEACDAEGCAEWAPNSLQSGPRHAMQHVLPADYMNH